MSAEQTMELAAGPALARPPASGPAPAAGPRPRIHHEPVLDGLRGLAVVAVVVFHLDHLRGGFLGADLSFVLSGFLITSLLVAEHRGRGRVDLRAFWVRRARRLLPALLVMLAGVAVLLAALTPAADRPRFRGAALATLGYVANWQRMFDEVSYWDIFSQPSPLDHTWSLAIEEQFYLVWPLVALVVLAGAPGRRVRWLGWGAVAGAVVSLALLAATWSPGDSNRAYFGTDTRLGPTLLGAALAAFVAGRPRRSAPPRPATEAAGVLALAVLAASVVLVDGEGAGYYRGGLAAFAVATLVVIATVTGGPPGRLALALAWRPLAVLGVVSYGVYLWHWPVIVYLTPERVGLDGWVLDAVCVAVTLAVAVVSYRVVEQPVLRGALRGRWAALAAATSVAAVAAAVVVTRGPAVAGGGGDVAAGAEAPRSMFPDAADVPAGAARCCWWATAGPSSSVRSWPTRRPHRRRGGGHVVAARLLPGAGGRAHPLSRRARRRAADVRRRTAGRRGAGRRAVRPRRGRLLPGQRRRGGRGPHRRTLGERLRPRLRQPPGGRAGGRHRGAGGRWGDGRVRHQPPRGDDG